LGLAVTPYCWLVDVIELLVNGWNANTGWLSLLLNDGIRAPYADARSLAVGMVINITMLLNRRLREGYQPLRWLNTAGYHHMFVTNTYHERR